MSINSEITRISNAKTDLSTILTARSISIPQGSLISDYPDLLEGMLSLCTPYEFDYKKGYVDTDNPSWIYQPSANNNYNDIYRVFANHKYTIFCGNPVGNKFKNLFVTQDVTQLTINVSGTLIYAATPTIWKRIVTTENPTHTWTAPSDGYIIIQKDNASTSGLKTYVIDLTFIDSYPTPDPYED